MISDGSVTEDWQLRLITFTYDLTNTYPKNIIKLFICYMYKPGQKIEILLCFLSSENFE